MRGAGIVVAALVACSNPSRLDRGSDQTATPDPWRTKPAADDDRFDLQRTIAKIRDAIAKPGPYEAPETSADYRGDQLHWGVLTLAGAVVEREAFSLTGGHGIELRPLVERLHELAKDDHLSGLVLRVGALAISLPDAVELRAAMHEFRASGKALRCHAESATNATYLVLAACDSIGLAPLGEVAITGPAAMPIHIKGLLDKLGIQADFLHVGAFKGAAEPLTRDAPSKEMAETLHAILDRRYQTMVDTIAGDRKLAPEAVEALIDTGLFTADAALTAKLVDVVEPFEAFRATPWTRIELEPEHADQLGSMIKLARFVGAMPPDRPTGDHVALVYAIGNIVDGDGDGVLGARQQIAAHTLVAALGALAADSAVKAVVLRIDSGGGSAQASELIWHAVAELRAKKPVIVSMSDVAASGGYYIASGATKIFALDDTLTGSIGVVGGRIAPAAALAKLGIATFPMGRGKRATMMASLSPWTDDEKQMIQRTMEAVYKTFVGRVAAGRHLGREVVLANAQGRVWVGARAKELGLVDEIGGLDAAIAAAKADAKLAAATELEIYPPTVTLRDLLVGYGGGVRPPFGLAVEVLRGLEPSIADAAEHLVELVISFRTMRVQTIAILPVLQ